MRLTALALVFAILTGCQSLSSTSSLARVRVIDVSPDAPALDIYEGNSAIAYNLSSGTVTSYVSIIPGNYTFNVESAGSRQLLSSINATFNAGKQYTMMVKNPAASLQQAVLIDQGQASSLDAPSIRLIHQAVRSGPVDVYLVPAGRRLTSVTPVVTNLAPGAATGYLPVPAGISTAVMLPAGTMPSAATIAAHTGTQVNYVTGSARSLILLDPQVSDSQGLQVITTIDAEPID